MSSFTTDEVTRLADLARIALSEAETAEFAEELSTISSAMEKVGEVVTPDIPATSHPIPLTNVWREDVVTEEQLDRDELFACAPDHEDGKFAVPRILGEDA